MTPIEYQIGDGSIMSPEQYAATVAPMQAQQQKRKQEDVQQKSAENARMADIMRIVNKVAPMPDQPQLSPFTALDLRSTRDPWRLRTARAVADSEEAQMREYGQQVQRRQDMINKLAGNQVEQTKADAAASLADAQAKALSAKFGGGAGMSPLQGVFAGAGGVPQTNATPDTGEILLNLSRNEREGTSPPVSPEDKLKMLLRFQPGAQESLGQAVAPTGMGALTEAIGGTTPETKAQRDLIQGLIKQRNPNFVLSYRDPISAKIGRAIQNRPRLKSALDVLTPGYQTFFDPNAMRAVRIEEAQ